MNTLIYDSPCTTLCVLAAKSCCSRTTQLYSSSPGYSFGRLVAVFVLHLNVPNVFVPIPQFTILRSVYAICVLSREEVLLPISPLMSIQKGRAYPGDITLSKSFVRPLEEMGTLPAVPTPNACPPVSDQPWTGPYGPVCEKEKRNRGSFDHTEVLRSVRLPLWRASVV